MLSGTRGDGAERMTRYTELHKTAAKNSRVHASLFHPLVTALKDELYRIRGRGPPPDDPPSFIFTIVTVGSFSLAKRPRERISFSGRVPFFGRESILDDRSCPKVHET